MKLNKQENNDDGKFVQYSTIKASDYGDFSSQSLSDLNITVGCHLKDDTTVGCHLKDDTTDYEKLNKVIFL